MSSYNYLLLFGSIIIMLNVYIYFVHLGAYDKLELDCLNYKLRQWLFSYILEK